jgi:prefoldin subunit 5
MRAMRHLRTTALLAALLAAAGTSAQERHLHAVPLQRALPEQIAPVLSAHVGPGSSVTAYGNQLILNVTDREYAQIRELLQQLDSAPRSLSISVRGLRSESAQIRAGSARGNWGNDQVQLQTGGGWQPRNHTEVRVEQRSVRGSRGSDQQVRAVEGMATYIGSGSLQPFDTGYGTRQLVPVESGFYATARVIGDEVVVDIEQRDDRSDGRAIRTAGISTRVRGRLGEWIALGGVSQQQRLGERGIASYRDTQSDSSSDVAIKVELLE